VRWGGENMSKAMGSLLKEGSPGPAHLIRTCHAAYVHNIIEHFWLPKESSSSSMPASLSPTEATEPQEEDNSGRSASLLQELFVEPLSCDIYPINGSVFMGLVTEFSSTLVPGNR
jgi:hypothetical protein